MEEHPIGCIGFLFWLLRGGGSLSSDQPEELPYRKRDNFLTPAELHFFKVLKPLTERHFHVCSKVRISNLLYVVNRYQNLGHANRIDRKHVDFVLCDPKSMQPVLVIELDDSSHRRADRQARDELVDSAFKAAEMPILHVICRRQYNPEELKQQIRAALKPKDDADEIVSATLVEAEGNDEASLRGGPPQCPKCRIAMVERTGTRGQYKGKRFWGCPCYPECKHIVAID